MQLTGYAALLELVNSGEDLSDIVKDSFTGFCGEHICCTAGFIEQWPGRAIVWAIFDGDIGSNLFLSIHRHIQKVIDGYQPSVFNRLEMTCLDDFIDAHRWARMLGFRKEAVMEHYDQWGRTHTLYSRVRQ